MDISDTLLCLFSAKIEEQADSYVLEVPKTEVTLGEGQTGEIYRVGLLATESTPAVERTSERDTAERPGKKSDGSPSKPPVTEGDQRTLDIEDIGDQGDGIARVERGYVIIVPKTEKGDRVTITITDVRENVAFGELITREDADE